jgi:Fe-S cluster assembly protein SufD
MTPPTTIPHRDSYLSQLLTTVAAPIESIPWLKALRTQAVGFLQEETMPSSRDEEWRFTNISGLLTQQFTLPSLAQIDFKSLEFIDLPQRLAIVDGIPNPTLSKITNQEGLFIGTLAGAIDQGFPVTKYLGKQPGGEEVFTAINSSGFQDVAIIWVRNEITNPIHLLHIGTGSDTIAQPRILVVLERSAQATVVEEYLSAENDRRFTNSVAEIWLADNARLEHIRLQKENSATFHIGKTAISQARDSHYAGKAISLGSQMARHHWDVFQTGPQTSTVLNGLAMIGKQQIADTHSKIVLNHPHGQTNQLHKCIITDKAHGIFSGKVLVPQAAQQTNAAQLSRTLLLSPTARVDTKPQLEITADDVKCSHGATVSQLSDDELFYLQSRGLGIDVSRTLLVNAFAIEVIETIPIPAIREQLTQAVKDFQP